MISIANLKYFFYDWGDYNRSILLLVNNSIKYDFFQHILKYISYVFNISNFAIYYIIIAIAFLIVSKKEGLTEKLFLKYYNYLVQIGIAYAFIGLVYAALKFGINLPRPFCNEKADLIHTVINSSKERCLSSFPSAHTAISLLVSYSMWPFANKFEKFGLVFMVLLVIISRLALAMHYPADIFYSIIICTLLIYLSKIIYNKLEKNIIFFVGCNIYKKLMKITPK